MTNETRRTFLCAAAAATAGWSAPDAARKMPRDFTIVMGGGQRMTFGSLLGKVVAVELVLTTCVHCQRCASTMQKLLDEYGPKGFAVMGAAVDDGARMNLLSFQMKSGSRFPLGVADRVEAYKLIDSDPTQLVYFPNLIFVDRAGTIRSKFGGTDPFFLEEERNARAQIEALLKEGAPRAGVRK